MQLDDQPPLVPLERQIVLRPDQERLLGGRKHRLRAISELRQRDDGSLDVISAHDHVEIDETPQREIAVAGDGQQRTFVRNGRDAAFGQRTDHPLELSQQEQIPRRVPLILLLQALERVSGNLLRTTAASCR